MVVRSTRPERSRAWACRWDSLAACRPIGGARSSGVPWPRTAWTSRSRLPRPTPTTLAIADIGTDGTARYQFQTAGTSASSLDVESIRAAFEIPPAALHVGTLGLVLEPIATTLAGSVARTGADTLVMVDPNCRPQAIPDRAAYLARLGAVLGRADVVKASVDDLAYLWPDSSVADCAGRLLEGGSRVVLVTDGPGPVSCHTSTFTFEVAVPSVVPVDTVGAGDAFGGAFLARWIERGLGRDQLADETALREAIGLAVEVARLTCLRPGADPPRRHEVAWPAT